MTKKLAAIGLTGQIGAGKSTVSKILAGQGYDVIDADQVARLVVQKGTACLAELAMEFGVEILQADGTLNRRKLGGIVFPDPEKRLALNRITFPHITQEILKQLETLNNQGKTLAFIDAAVLFESDWHTHCDFVVSVIADRELRRQRILARDNLSEQEVDDRLNSQHSDAFYTSRSKFVLYNNAGLGDLHIQVLEMLDRLLALIGAGTP
jgi:dephospho-CoA kinase